MLDVVQEVLHRHLFNAWLDKVFFAIGFMARHRICFAGKEVSKHQKI